MKAWKQGSGVYIQCDVPIGMEPIVEPSEDGETGQMGVFVSFAPKVEECTECGGPVTCSTCGKAYTLDLDTQVLADERYRRLNALIDNMFDGIVALEAIVYDPADVYAQKLADATLEQLKNFMKKEWYT